MKRYRSNNIRLSNSNWLQAAGHMLHEACSLRLAARIFAFPFFVSVFAFNISSGPCAQTSAPKEFEGLVRVQDIDPSIVLDLRYATENNFTKKKVYPVAVCVLRKETAQKLAAANQEFIKDGYRIKVWDAYRPPSVQKIFWGLVPDDRYVANPYKGGSRHNRGGAVDVTLIDDKGNELDMPTGFDDFSKRANPQNPFMTAEQKMNVNYLKRVMVKHGFDPYEPEWWHFDDSDWKDYPLVDVGLERFLDETKESVPVVPAVLKKLKDEVTQAILVEEIPGAPTQVKVTAWRLQGNIWKSQFLPMTAVIGRRGFALAAGKREGDGRTPVGVYWLGYAFGYAPEVPTHLAYRQARENDYWVDDPESAMYNKWITHKPRARSYERMKRDDDLYKYGVVIEYNTESTVPGEGSAIFLHVWRGPDSPTSGCVALSEKNMLKLLKWLDRTQRPVIILGDYN